MADTTPPPTKWIRPEDSAQVYCNFHFLNWSLVDVRVRFGQLIPTDQSQDGRVGFVVEEQAAVTMSWVQAKALRDSLNDAVQRYEKANGVIEVTKLKLPE